MTDTKNTIELLRRGYDEPTRSLSFRVSFNRDWEAAFTCLRIIDRYNDFDAERVIAALRPFASEPTNGDSYIDVGREGSPVLYVKYGPLEEIGEALREAAADEIDIEGSHLRAWWD